MNVLDTLFYITIFFPCRPVIDNLEIEVYKPPKRWVFLKVHHDDIEGQKNGETDDKVKCASENSAGEVRDKVTLAAPSTLAKT